MKWVSAIALGLSLLSSQAYAKINVFACEPEWKSLVESLGGKHVKANSATTAFQDPHHIEARPSLIAKTRRADLLVCTGSELEIGWLPLLLRQSGNAKIQIGESGYFLASSFVDRIEIPSKMDRSQGDIHAGGNPHVHLGPYRMLTIADALTKRLIELDPEHKTDYESNLASFTTQWKAQIIKWEALAEPLKGKQVIVYHKNWSYLLKWLGVEAIADLEPKPGLPPTSSHLASLLKQSRTNTPSAIIMANYQDDKGAKWLSKKTGVTLIKLPFSVGGTKAAKDLIGLYNDVLSTLTQIAK